MAPFWLGRWLFGCFDVDLTPGECSACADLPAREMLPWAQSCRRGGRGSVQRTRVSAHSIHTHGTRRQQQSECTAMTT